MRVQGKVDGTHIPFKVVAHELERVVEGVDGGELDIWRRLFLSCAMYDCCEDIVCSNAEDIGFLSGRSRDG